MKFMDLKNRINNRHIVIYGAGTRAKALRDALGLADIRAEQFVVSDCESIFNGPTAVGDILHISEWYNLYSESKDEYVFLIAVDPRFFPEIKTRLRDLSIDCIGMTDEDVRELTREFKRIDDTSFLRDIRPVSSVFGFDRGTPIDRWYIDQFLYEQTRQILDVSQTLEVAEKSYSEKFFPGAVHDILNYENGQDLTDINTLISDQYDVFIATQVFNFIFDVRKAIAGAHFLLKKGGVLLATVAGNVSPVSKYDMDRWGDYWRFTDLSIKRLMEETFGESVSVFSYGNAATATAFVQGLAVEDLEDRDVLKVQDPIYSVCIGIVARK